MSVVFDSQPGRVVAMQATIARPFILNMGVHGLVSGIATSVDVESTVAAQVALSLSNDVFITPFGDNPSNIQIRFILNGKGCNDADAVSQFIDAYQGARLGPYQNKFPQQFVVGGESYVGYIMGCRVGATVDGGQRLYTGTLSAIAWAVHG
jgi:hypothetical protein